MVSEYITDSLNLFPNHFLSPPLPPPGSAQSSTYNLETPASVRVEELVHRLHVERRCMEGAKNAVRTLMTNKMAVDKKYQQEVSF